MSNVLKVSLQTTIYSLADLGWSQRRIASELGINRETVGRYLRLAKSANSITGSEEGADRRPTISIAGAIKLFGQGLREAVSRQDTETFLRCLENGLRSFGGERISVWDSPHPREKAKNHKTHRKFVRRSTTICHTFASAHFHRFLP
jgi:DNA-binding transcriptional regulator LsrR (DeoR family)